MPELVNIKVGSLAGTSELDGTMAWPRARKKSRKAERISEVFMRIAVAGGRGSHRLGANRSATAGWRWMSGKIVGVVHFGVGNTSYCGGGKAAAQEELCPAGAFGGVVGACLAVASAQLGGGRRVPVDLRRVQQLADAGVGQAVAFQLLAQAHGSVALGNPAAQQHFGEAVVVLVVLLAQTIQRRSGFLALVAALAQLGLQFLARMLAAGEQAQRLLVGAALGFGRVARARTLVHVMAMQPHTGYGQISPAVLPGRGVVEGRPFDSDPADPRPGGPAGKTCIVAPRYGTWPKRAWPGRAGPCACNGTSTITAHASSSASSGPAAAALPTGTSRRSRSCLSISLAMAGLSRRNWRTFSLPWPMRSPL